MLLVLPPSEYPPPAQCGENRPATAHSLSHLRRLIDLGIHEPAAGCDPGTSSEAHLVFGALVAGFTPAGTIQEAIKFAMLPPACPPC